MSMYVCTRAVLVEALMIELVMNIDCRSIPGLKAGCPPNSGLQAMYWLSSFIYTHLLIISYKFGTRLVRRGLGRSLRVTTEVPMEW